MNRGEVPGGRLFAWVRWLVHPAAFLAYLLIGLAVRAALSQW